MLVLLFILTSTLQCIYTREWVTKALEATEPFFKYETTLYHYSAILSFYGTSRYATVIVKTQVVNLVACYERDL